MDTTNKSQNIIQGIQNGTNIFLKDLENIWDQIGIDPEERHKRLEIISTYFREIAKDVLTEAKDEQRDLLKSIEVMLQEIDKLEKELRISNLVDTYENVPFMQVKMDLKQKIKKYCDILARKHSEIKNLLSREKVLCEALGKIPKLLTLSPIPVKKVIESFKLYLEELGNEKFVREEKFLLTKASMLEMIEELKFKPSLDFEKLVLFGDDSTFMVTDENMSRLDNFFSSLKAQRESVRCEVGELREQLSALWLRLEEGPQYTNEFTERYSGFDVPTCNALKIEISRCQAKITDNIKIFVEKIRHEIRILWEKCRFGSQEKAEFIYYTSDCFTEDLLFLHELQVEKLKKLYNKNKAIYNLILKRETLWDKMLDLERRANEPNRFKNRGGQLLKEEKERNSVLALLPKIEEKILILVDAYEKRVGLPFKIDGEPIADKIVRDRESHNENRQLSLSAKRQDREQGTPQKSSRSILTHVSSGLKSVTPDIKTPAKRTLVTPLFGTSAAKNTKQVSNIPKIQVNGCTIRRVSREREKRLEKRRSRRLEIKKFEEMLEISDYNDFEVELKNKPSCRSTLAVEECVTNHNKTRIKDATSPGPQTPHVFCRTYSKTSSSEKSPILR